MDGPGVTADINAVIIGMVGMFFLTIVIIVFVVIYQRKLIAQERKHKKAEEEHQLELLQATLESQENERDRIGRELHDGVGVLLTTARMYLRHNIEEEAEQNNGINKQVDAMLGETIESVRRVSADLRPVVLETLGLAEAIGELVRHIGKASSVDIQFEHSYDYPLSQKHELSVYRVVQELLTNGLRHAEASAINVDLNAQPHLFSLTYSDNGKGISSSDIEKKGLGLKNMESRVNALKGKLKITNPEEGGVMIHIQIDRQ
ncbi:sensor histidine kinase [Roseivirga pacifica]|uniref:sensor histidine kinase n=1 Tax=Roseivirga pacifica TaxID=1267423 RepID=UPI003BA94088